MLLIVAAKVMHQAAQCHGPVAFEYRRPRELPGVETAQQHQRALPRGAKLGERAPHVAAAVAALDRQRFAVNDASSGLSSSSVRRKRTW